MCSKAAEIDEISDKGASDFEQKHVHAVYQEIADDFSRTRYKAWPVVEDFLSNFTKKHIGIDVGCGNGKYMKAHQELQLIGCDKSQNLTKIAAKYQHCVIADILSLPFAQKRFDYLICIAVVHHISTRSRRVKAIRNLLQMLIPKSGRALIYVWALEQSNSKRGWDQKSPQDVFVPWNLACDVKKESKTLQRYYHLYRKGELEQEVQDANGLIESSGYDRDNYWAIANSF